MASDSPDARAGFWGRASYGKAVVIREAFAAADFLLRAWADSQALLCCNTDDAKSEGPGLIPLNPRALGVAGAFGGRSALPLCLPRRTLSSAACGGAVGCSNSFGCSIADGAAPGDACAANVTVGRRTAPAASAQSCIGVNQCARQADVISAAAMAHGIMRCGKSDTGRTNRRGMLKNS